MAYTRTGRRPPDTTKGTGLLRYPGFSGPVDYEITGALKQLRPGVALRASITTTPEIAAEAFRELQGHLQLEDGRDFRLKMLAYTAGSATAYVELTL